MAKKLKAGLVVERVPLDTINEAEVNPNKHPERNIAAIRTSLEQFGQVEPLVVRLANREVIGGNGRLQAMREMGWTEADVVFVDVDDTQAKAMGLALNRTGQLAEWDFEELAGLMRELQEGGVNLTDLGWMDYEIEPLLKASWSAPLPTADPAPGTEPPASEPAKDDPVQMGLPIKLTKGQRMTIDAAMESVRQSESEPGMSEGRCIELICADYMAGAAAQGGVA